jgi:hypothetical protein
MPRRTAGRGRLLNGKQFDARLKSELRQEAALIFNATKKHTRHK